MGKSIAVGVQAALDRFEELSSLAVHLCDTPLIDASHLSKILEQGDESEVVLTQYDETTGVPACFGSTVFDQLLFLDGEAGARSFLSKDQIEDAVKVPFRGGFVDIDLPEDLNL